MSYSLIFLRGHAGGLGDRITGMMTVKSFADIFKKSFYVIWDIDLSRIFSDSIFKYQLDSKRLCVDMFNNHNNLKFKDVLLTCKGCPFPEGDIYFRSNMTTAQYLYDNPNFDLDYDNEMIRCHKGLYRDIMIPTEEFLKMVEPYRREHLIGIQVRTGDFNFYDDQSKNIDKFSAIKDDEIEKCLRDLYKKIEIGDRDVYITSDNAKVIEVAKEVFKGHRILFNESAIVHIDISSNRDSIADLFIDHYVLCKFAEELYVSDYSNFGRTIVLCSDSNRVFNIKGEPVSRAKLVRGKVQQ